MNRIENISSNTPISSPQIVQQTQNDGSFSQVLAATLNASTNMDAIFAQASEHYQVPLNLLKAVGRTESNFNANAVSKAGAQGVMQLMPRTAASLGVSDSFNPVDNIMGGAKYIRQLLDKYDNNVKLALAAYNAGSGNVAKYGGIPPFEGTRRYVDKVLRYADEYQGAPLSNDTTAIANNYTNGKTQSLTDRLEASFSQLSTPSTNNNPESIFSKPFYENSFSSIFEHLQSSESYSLSDHQLLTEYLKLNMSQSLLDLNEEESSSAQARSYSGFNFINLMPSI